MIEVAFLLKLIVCAGFLIFIARTHRKKSKDSKRIYFLTERKYEWDFMQYF